MAKHVNITTYNSTESQYEYNPAYQVKNIKVKGTGSDEEGLKNVITLSSGLCVGDMVQSYFMNNEFFKDDNFQTGNYVGSGSTNTPASIETEFYPNLIYVYGISNLSTSTRMTSVMAVLYPRLGYGKSFFACNAMSEYLPVQMEAHGLQVEYYDGVTTFYNGYVDKDNNAIMNTQLNYTNTKYYWVAFG